MGRGVRARAAGWTGGALLALAGCVVAPAEDADCEGGTAYSEAGNAMCVYRGGIQETGFECPDAMPHRGDFDDFTVCSERPVDRPMADRAWCASGHCEAPRELPDGGAPGGGSPDSGVPTAAIPPLPEDFDPGNA
ncbi:MAG: hypothetical protein H6704_15760, partial [Myxococcales bacterium]|nr:hypothetical protein [Myxococcales bacterium]